LKAIAIDPAERRILVEDVDPTPRELMRLCAAPRRVVATLPNGDILLAAEGGQSDAGFSIGGSKAIRSSAIVLGRRDSFGEHTAARSSVDLLTMLVRWINAAPVPEPVQSGETIMVVIVDPEIGVIDYVGMDPTAAAMDSLVGGEAVPLMKAPGDDVVYGKTHASGWRWKKDDCVFNGRCVIVGSDRTSEFADPVASVRVLRRDVRFGPPGKTQWLGYHKHPARMGTNP
jgi:hypothetical protein